MRRVYVEYTQFIKRKKTGMREKTFSHTLIQFPFGMERGIFNHFIFQ